MNHLLLKAFVKKIKSENMNKNLQQLKDELKEWEDMVPVNNMGKWARQTKIDNLKKEIDDYEKFLKDKMESLFEKFEQPEIKAVFKRLNDK